MNYTENFREGLRSIQANMLRAVLTALIIAIGITSLVGILTAIDGIQSSVNNSFADLGANTFDIEVPQWRRRNRGLVQKQNPPITYRQAQSYHNEFKKKYDAKVSISSQVAGAVQAKYLNKKTNPNVQVQGVEDNYLTVKGYKLLSGRNLTRNDLDYSLNVTIIGDELAKNLFDKGSPIGKEISLMGGRYVVIGVLDKKGSLTGGGDDRVALVPLNNGRGMAANRALSFNITTSVANQTDPDIIMEEARGVMRRVRGDLIGKSDSFEMERSDSLAKDFEDITGYLRIGGFVIGIITLLGASIALMNIMLVSVTERTREIGIRKSLGATPRVIRIQFLMEAICICLLGALGGLVLGIAVGNVIANSISEKSSFIIPWVWMLMGIAISVFVGIASGIYPAIKASKLDPIDALRYE